MRAIRGVHFHVDSLVPAFRAALLSELPKVRHLDHLVPLRRQRAHRPIKVLVVVAHVADARVPDNIVERVETLATIQHLVHRARRALHPKP